MSNLNSEEEAMNHYKSQSLLRVTSTLIIISIIATSLLAIPTLPAWAQADNPTTPAQSQPTLQETVQQTLEPTAEPSPTESPTGPVAPEPTATASETPSLEPTLEPSLEPTLEPSPTLLTTETPTATPEALAHGKLAWKLSMSVPVPSDQVQAMGGAAQTGAQLQSTLDKRVKSKNAKARVKSSQGIAAGTDFQVEVDGSNSPDELRQMIYADLGADFDFLGGPADVTLTADVEQGQDMTVLLESRPGTGFTWEVQSVEPAILEQVTGADFETKSNGPGAQARESLRLHATGSGAVSLHLVYHRPFEGGAVTRDLQVQAPEMPATLDLSSPLTPLTPPMGEVQGAAPPEPSVQADGLIGLPASFDWRSQDKVTPIRNQGACGGCWAFGTVGAMESAILIALNQKVDLSEQYLISCNTSGWGCSGGWWAHDMHTNTGGKNGNGPGAVLESDKPYTATNGSCTAVYNHPYKLAEWHYITGATSVPSVDQIKSAIYNHGPVAAAVCSVGFSSYTNGVYSKNNTCNGGVDHGIVLVGWDDSTQTWILRNSWGSSWGESGYMHIKWNTSNVGYGATYVAYTAPAPVAPPSNDDINNAIGISNAGGIARFSETKIVSGATLNSSDPTFPWATPRPGDHTVWYRFTTFSGGKLTVNTRSSNYDTVLGVYTGQPGSLKRVAWNDNISSTVRQSAVTITALANTTYYIEAASKTSTAGNLTFKLVFTPPTTGNNGIGAPRQLKDNGKGYKFSERKDIYTATTVTSDPFFPLSSGSTRGFRTIWYRFYPLTNGTLTVNTQGSNFDTLLGVWQGSTTALKQVKWDDDSGGSGTSSLSVLLPGRHYYYIEVADKNQGSANSHLTFNLSFGGSVAAGIGTYDGNDNAIVYLPDWSVSSVTGTIGNTLNLSNSKGEIAALTFSGRRARLKYSRLPLGGYLSIYIDGSLKSTIRQAATTATNNYTWTGPLLASGKHTIKVVHSSGGKVNIDGIVVE